MSPDRPRAWLVVALPVIAAIAMFGLRMLGPSTLFDGDQMRPSAYALDAARNGNWIIQTDPTGIAMSKPPLSTWLTAALFAPVPWSSDAQLCLPGLLALLGMILMLVGVASRWISPRAALLGGLMLVLTKIGYKQVAFARSDALLSMCVFAAALLGYRAWRLGRGWTWFWLAAAAGTLTKGPAGLVLASGGFLAALWEKRSGQRRPFSGRHGPGVALYLVIGVGWAALAYASLGQAFVDEMIGRELIAHAVHGDTGEYPLMRFYQPVFYMLTRFAPWSFLTIFGLVRVFRRPAEDDDERWFERYATCQLLAGLAVLAVAGHQRADLMWPMVPAAALIAGQHLARLTASWSARRLVLTSACTAVALLSIVPVYDRVVRTRDDLVAASERAWEIAHQLTARGASRIPFLYQNGYALQFQFSVMRPMVPLEVAERALAGDAPAFVLRTLDDRSGWHPPIEIPGVRTLEEWTLWPGRRIALLSNHPRLEPTERYATYAADLLVEASGLELASAPRGELSFRKRSDRISLLVTNPHAHPLSRRVTIRGVTPAVERVVDLGPGETRRIALDDVAILPNAPERSAVWGLVGLAAVVSVYAALLAIGGAAAWRAAGARGREGG